MRVVALVIISLILGLGGLLLWRGALDVVGGFRIDSSQSAIQLLRLARLPSFWMGTVLLLGVALISLELYGNEALSRVVPLYSLGYLAVALLDRFHYGLEIPLSRWGGIALIMTGVILVAQPSR